MCYLGHLPDLDFTTPQENAIAVRTLLMRSIYAHALSQDDGATLDDVREALETLADAERIARRVFGGTHPLLVNIEAHLRCARAALCARDTSCTCVPVPPPSPLGRA